MVKELGGTSLNGPFRTLLLGGQFMRGPPSNKVR